MAVLPAYESVLKLGRERPDGICWILELVVGRPQTFPLRNITTDWLSSAFFDLGYDLFKTTPASHPIGDVFKPEMTTNLPAVR